jgi:biopolymer transport protein ExbB
MVPLLLLSLLVVALILERLLFWRRVLKRQKPLIREVLRLYRQDPEAAFLELEQNSDLPLARIFLNALRLEHPAPEDFRLALESATQAELPLLRRFSTVFETAIAISPLLGLLGTILGLIQTFSALTIGEIGGINTAGVTGGISEALISTVAGLCVAIFTLLFANGFRGLYRRQLALIQEYGTQLELLYRFYYERDRLPYLGRYQPESKL